MGRYLLLFTLVFAAATASAQRTVRGVVVSADDSTATPGATVACIVAERQVAATVTAADGKFAIDTDGKDDCRVQVSFVGFEPYSISIPKSRKGDIDLGHIYLSPSNTRLDGVTVSAQTQRVDRSLVFPQESDLKVSYDVYSLLRTLNLRGMTVDETARSVSVNGKSPQWKINGVPKTDEDVRNIKPKDVLRIEYSDNPSIRELDRGYGGVVNIVLKERTEGGNVYMNGRTAFTTGFVDGGAGVQYHKAKSSLSLDYSVSHRGYDEWRRDEQSDFITPTETINRDMRGLDSKFGYTNHFLNLNYTLHADEKTQLSASFKNSFGVQHNIPEAVYGDNILRRQDNKWSSYLPSLDLFFGKTFANNSRLEANLVGSMMVDGKSRYTLTDTRGGEVVNEYSIPSNSERRSLISEVFYSYPISTGHTLAVGLQNKIGGTRNDYLEPENSRDKLDENNTYAYVQAYGRLGTKVQYSFGTGMKYNHVDNGINREDFWRNQTTLSLSYSPVNEWFFRYDMYYYPSLPSLFAMTSVVQRMDDLQTLQGNPYLKSAQNLYNNIMIYYRKGVFTSNLTVGYTHTADPIFLAKGYDGQSGLFTNSYINGRHSNSLDIRWQPTLRGLWAS